MAKAVYRIHPAIGIARVGNADASTFFLGPETPGLGPREANGKDPVKYYKKMGKVRPQAARFRIWEYVWKGRKLTANREINLDTPGVEDISWTVHLANKKASFFMFQGLWGYFVGKAQEQNQYRNSPDRKDFTKVPGLDESRTPPDPKKFDIDPGPLTISGRLLFGWKFAPNPFSSTKQLWPTRADGTKVISYLGELRTDGQGRLIVIGGKGKAATSDPSVPLMSSKDPYNNDRWFDDVSDGPVTAKITFKKPDGSREEVEVKEEGGAWVIVGPPDYAPGIQNIVTLYDTVYDVAARKLSIPEAEEIYDSVLKPLKDINAILKGVNAKRPKWLNKYRVSFLEEIFPILKRALDMRWVFGLLLDAHTTLGALGNESMWASLAEPAGTTADSARDTVFRRLRPPPGYTKKLESAGFKIDPKVANMPPLAGDDIAADSGPERYYLSLTITQYCLLRQWWRGKFDKPSGKVPPAPRTSPDITPHGLDRAALESAVGGGFHPGIEVGWQIRNPKIYAAPFRIKHGALSPYNGKGKHKVTIGPGFFTRQMAVPWHTDFRQCWNEEDPDTSTERPPERPMLGLPEVGWWPGQRPDKVYTDATVAAKIDEKKTSDMESWDRHTKGHTWSAGGPYPEGKDMVKHWCHFGFVVPDGKVFIEKERGEDSGFKLSDSSSDQCS